jgi:hypothetical protein
MTLIITAASRPAIHQSSDYRISNKGVPVETINGTKQMSVSAMPWTGRIAFTGIASDGHGYDTRTWIVSECQSISPQSGPSDPAEFVTKLALRGTTELRTVKTYDRRLTIVVSIAMSGVCRLFTVSNFEEHSKNLRRDALDALHVFEWDLSSPVVVVNGDTGALPRWEKKAVERMFRQGADTAELWDRMAAANRLASSRPGHGNLISPGCWVSSLFADGRSNDTNYGQLPGVPSQVMAGVDFGKWLAQHLKPAPGQKIAINRSPRETGAAGEGNGW